MPPLLLDGSARWGASGNLAGGESSSARLWPRPGTRPREHRAGLQVPWAGSRWPCRCTAVPASGRLLHRQLVALCPNLQGQRGSGAGSLHGGWPRVGRAAQRLWPLEVSGSDPRPPPRTCPSSRAAMFCADSRLYICFQGPQLWQRPPRKPPPPAPPHRLTDGLEVKGLKLLGHLLRRTRYHRQNGGT